MLARGTRLRCFGEVRRGPLGLEMVHPEYRRLTEAAAPLEETLTPIYPLTEGVPQGRLRALIAEALRELERAPLRDLIPREAGCRRVCRACPRRSTTCTARRARRSSPNSPPAATRRSSGSPSRSCWRITWR